MKRSLSFLLIFPLAAFFGGCSVFRSSTQVVSVATDQADTDIYINGKPAGKGSATAAVRRNREATVLIQKKGYIPVYRTLEPKLNKTGKWDIVGGCFLLFPFLGLLAPGSHSLNETEVNILMIKQ